MSHQEKQTRFFSRETVGNVWDEKKGLQRAFEQAREVVERHPIAATMAAVVGGLVAYEIVRREENKQRPENEQISANPLEALGGMVNKFKENPGSIVEEAHVFLNRAEEYVGKHKALTFAVAVGAPFVFEKVIPFFEGKAAKVEQRVRARRQPRA